MLPDLIPNLDVGHYDRSRLVPHTLTTAALSQLDNAVMEKWPNKFISD